MLAKHGSKYVEGPSPTASRFADPAPAVAARPQQDNGSDHPGHGSSGTEPGGRIAADGWGRVTGEASWRCSHGEGASAAVVCRSAVQLQLQ